MNLRFVNFRFKILNRGFLLLASCLLFLASNGYAQKDKKKEKEKKQANKDIVVIEGKKYKVHKVEKGQTLYAISKIYNVTVQDIVVANQDAIDGIKAGQELMIPLDKSTSKEKSETAVVKTEAIDSSKYVFHKIEQGQTMFSIMKMYGVSENVINDNNSAIAKEGLKTGQMIKFPKSKVKNKKEEKPTREEQVKKTEKLPAAQDVKPVKKEQVAEPVKGSTETAKQHTMPVEVLAEEPPVFKEKYHVALFLPFQTDEALALDQEQLAKGTVQLPSKSELALSFYQGAMLAFDSLRKAGLNAVLHVYETPEADSTKVEVLKGKKELDSVNLIIGPLYTTNFMEVAKFAKQHHIPIVSPLSQQNKVLFNNPYVSKATSSTMAQVRELAKYAAARYKASHIILVNKYNVKDSAYLSAFKSTFVQEYEKRKSSPADTIKEVNYNSAGFEGVKSRMHTTDTNIVVLLSTSQVYVTDFITRLYTFNDKDKKENDKYPVILFGMQAWTGFETIDNEYLNRYQLHLPSNSFIDYDKTEVKNFVSKFRDTYYADPNVYAFQGFDVTWYYLSALKLKGINFQSTLGATPLTVLQTGFDFYQHTPESGFENKWVCITAIKDFKLVRVK